MVVLLQKYLDAGRDTEKDLSIALTTTGPIYLYRLVLIDLGAARL